MPHPVSPARRARLALTLLALCAGMLTTNAMATVMRAEQLAIYRDGTSADWAVGANRLLGDGFDNGLPLVGPAFSSNGVAATYELRGALSPDAAREQAGQLLLDPNLGAVAANAVGNLGPSVRLRLLTNTSDVNGGLNIGRSFAATLRLSLSAAPDPGQAFGLRLTDGGIATSNNDVVELSWSAAANGSRSIVFRKQDFDNHAITVLGVAPVLAPAGAAMLVLSLSHQTIDSPLILASYGFADANGTRLGTSTSFGAAATAFGGEAYTRVELRASGLSAPVPEPSAWALMAGGLGLLLAGRRRPR